MPTIAFIGDSITAGAADPEHGGWARRLAAQLPQDWEAIHAGVGGDTIWLLLQRLEHDALIFKPDILVLAVGINDSRRYTGGRYEVTPEDFERGLAEFAGRLEATGLQAAGAQVLVVGLTPVDEPRTLPIAEDLHYTQIAVRDYDAALARFAGRHGFAYVPLLAAFSAAGGAEALTADGLHPTAEGHAIIAAAVRTELEKLIEMHYA